MTLKEFKVYCPMTVKSIDKDGDDLIISGIASTLNKDLDNEIVTENALESLCKQATALNLHIDHEHSIKGIIGTIIDAVIKDHKLYITAKILPEFADKLKQSLDFGINYGFSIGGIPTYSESNYTLIDDFKLLEISLVALPANWDSFSTVEAKGLVTGPCVSGVCHLLNKSLENNTMNEEQQEQDVLTKEDVIQLLNELVAEKEQTIIDEVISNIEGQIESIVLNVLAEQEEKPQEDETGESEEKGDCESEEKEVESEEETEEKETETEESEESEESEEEIPEEEAEEKEAESEEEETQTEEETPENEEESEEKNYDSLLHQKQTSKFETATKSSTKKNTFLNSEIRDHLGRNKKYL